MNSISRVIIVGQPNVGKSVLFNRLSRSNQAITSSSAHTTRDNNRAICSYNNVQFELIDSAGYAKTDDPLSKLAIANLQSHIAEADLVLMVVDGTAIVNNNDLKLSKIVRDSKKPTMLLVNKLDKKDFQQRLDTFRKLGIDNILQISAQNNLGIQDLQTEIINSIPRKKAAKNQPVIRVALLGRPNAGKSALLNALSEKDLALVSEIAGTTRDVNTSTIKYQSKLIELGDTAGLRRKGKIGTGIEFYSASRTKKAISSSDVCLVLIDANDLVTKQDEHIIGLVKDEYKPLIVVVSKWDSVANKDENSMKIAADAISHSLQYVWWAPLIFTSANPESDNKQNLEKLKQLLVATMDKQNTKLATTRLNNILRAAIIKQPPVATKGKRAKLNYITQTGQNPLQVTIFGTHPELIHFSYRRYLENQIRANFDLSGVPLKIIFKSKHKTD